MGAALAVESAQGLCSRALVVGQPKVSKGSDEPRPESHASVTPLSACARAPAQLAAAGRVGECGGGALAVGGEHSVCSIALVVGQPKVSKGTHEPRPKSHASLPTECQHARERARSWLQQRGWGSVWGPRLRWEVHIVGFQQP